MHSLLRSAADRALRRPALARTALSRAARGGRSIALIWHRVGPGGPQPHEVVRTVPTSSFTAQLDLLQELGEIVPLEALERREPARRPRFALTFDDDDPGHADHVLPILADRGLPATFFLSGRWEHGLGPYWWEVLEQDIADRGAPAVAAEHGLPPDRTPVQIARELTGSAGAAALAEDARSRPAQGMDARAAAALVDGGMEVGFHTIDHDVLPNLDAARLAAVLRDGRDELARSLGVALERFAYPHGRADERVAAATSLAGYRSAWTTAKRVVGPRSHPMLHGRWDIGHLPQAGIRALLVRGLARPR